MTRELLMELLGNLQQAGFIPTEPKNSGDDHLGFSCLMARWKHQTGFDLSPSMTVSINPSGDSMVKCHACQYSNTLVGALVDLNVLCRGTIQNLVDWVKGIEGTLAQFAPPSREKKKEKPIYDYTQALAPFIANPLPAEAMAFLAEKGVDQATAEKYRIGWAENAVCSRSNGDTYEVHRAIVFPIWAVKDGRVICVGAQGRELERRPTRSKYFMFFRCPTEKFFLGDHLLGHARDQRVLLVEGPLDAYHLLGLGEVALGLIGTYLSRAKAEKLQAAGPRMVYILLDPDEAGDAGAAKAKQTLDSMQINAAIIKLSKDPKRLGPDDLGAMFVRR